MLNLLSLIMLIVVDHNKEEVLKEIEEIAFHKFKVILFNQEIRHL